MISLQSQTNPYVIGRPIHEENLFFGRQEQISFIKENLRRGEKVLLLHGQRRIGKSSLLHNIPKLCKSEKLTFISFDLEYFSQANIEVLLENLAESVVQQLHLKLEVPVVEQIKTQPDILYTKFLPQVYQKIQDKNLVLLLDEFDALNNKYIGTSLETLFKQLQKFIYNNKQLSIIIFAGRNPADLYSLLDIFPKVPVAEVSFLDDDSAKQLITKPAEGFLQYESNAIQAIINLSSGHPYFIQILCFEIFSRARSLEKWEVNQEDVENIIDHAIELAEAGFAWYWEGLSHPEKVVFSAIAEAQKLGYEPLMLLKKHNIFSENTLKKLMKGLALKGFLHEQNYKIKIELVRLWLLQRHPLWQEVREWEKIGEKSIDSNYETENQIHQISDNSAVLPANNLTYGNDLNHSHQNLHPKKSYLQTLIAKLHLIKPEVWLVALFIVLGSAAIAISTAIMVIHAPKQSNNEEPNQNVVPTNATPETP
jgi:hypothetical protein